MEFWEAEDQMVGYSLTAVDSGETKVMVLDLHSDAVPREKERPKRTTRVVVDDLKWHLHTFSGVSLE